ncbi:hypothetical protein GCM10007855_36750 [Aliivibrio sifiae]|uniref:Resolvase HTH domain-containing protein n=1 Tax=Aliivibrio sifiae TaxID=566293 RepID=A0ABQ6AML5_9GAMM|nr:hypothetical protein GCM10007855_36750 [Aliivibrio sifiae]
MVINCFFLLYIIQKRADEQAFIFLKRKLGIIGGRPKGPAKNLKLDKQKEKITEYLSMGLSQASIAKSLEVSASTLSGYIRRHKLKSQAEKITEPQIQNQIESRSL